MLFTEPKERIKSATHDLIMQYSVRSVSMNDIASKAGMSKKTLYQYFTDKDELVEAVVEDVLIRNKCNCDLDREKAKDPIHEVFLSLEMMAEMFQSMNPSLIFDLQKYHPNAFRRFMAHKNEYLFNIIFDNIQRGIQQELYRPDINPHILARYRVEVIMIAFNPDFIRNTKSSLLEVEEEIILNFLYGLVTLKGYKLITKYSEERQQKTKK